jgi:tripartite-type tricarboxylate transporter receptor subunit TctC
MLGTLRGLAAATRERIELLPALPTVAEAGYKGIEADIWNGLFAPAGIPPERLSELIHWFSAALQAPEIRLKLAAHGLVPVGLCGADFAAFIRDEYEDNGRVTGRRRSRRSEKLVMVS